MKCAVDVVTCAILSHSEKESKCSHAYSCYKSVIMFGWACIGDDVLKLSRTPLPVPCC